MASRPPVCVFAFKRPEHLRAALAALARNHGAAESSVTIYCDGARDERDHDGVRATRAVARGATGFGSLRVVERDANLGLARSIIDGVGAALAACDQVIVLEDDLVTAPGFLDYMRDGLALYADDERVASVHGYLYPVPGPAPETFFIRGADCWGWGSWRRAWARFEPDGALLLRRLEESGLLADFNHGGRAPMFGFMLAEQVAGRNDSWAIRWQAANFLANRLTLYPGRSLVQNVGFDSTGTHCEESDVYHVPLAEAPVAVRPIEVAADARMTAQFGEFFARVSAPRRKTRRERARRFWRRLARRFGGPDGRRR
jgi:hypothetical protein